MKASNVTRETILDMGVKDRGFPKFDVGDRIEVAQLIVEGDKERIQKFEGDVIAYHHNGIGTTFTVRRIGAGGIGVERIFPYHAPVIQEIKLIRAGKVRRAKLFYIRKRLGKQAQVQARENEQAPAQAPTAAE